MKKFIAVLLTALMVCQLAVFCTADDGKSDDIVIIYTNDVHCNVDGNIGYAGLKAYVDEEKSLYNYVTLVDAGDAVQGAPIGTVSKGGYITDIMNDVGYDLAVCGNHEFDYGMAQLQTLTAKASFKYISCNLKDLKTGKNMLDAYVIKDYGGVKVAFVGINTPHTLTTSNPSVFKDENGNYIYGFCEGDNGKELYSAVQSAIDSAYENGANYVVALAHLGVDDNEEASSDPWTSVEVIKNTSGLTAVIDGHSHSTIECRRVNDKSGKSVVLTQTGTQLKAIGKLTINSSGAKSVLVTDYTNKDANTVSYINSIKEQYSSMLSQVVGVTDYDLSINDENGNRIVRTEETNLGDFCADAYRFITGADIALINGGGVRASIKKGNITYGDLISVQPYSNMVCVVKATGRQIADALEMGSRLLPNQNGGFLQVSGLKYFVNTSVPSTVTTDDKGMFTGVTGARRVYNITVFNSATGEYEPLDLDREYTLASHNYLIKNGGDGMNMFMNDYLVADETVADNQAITDYLQYELGGRVSGAKYSNIRGEGRITISDSEIHIWDGGVVTKEPTVDSEGVMTYTCTICGETKTQSVPRLESSVSVAIPDTGKNSENAFYLLLCVPLFAVCAVQISSKKKKYE